MIAKELSVSDNNVLAFLWWKQRMPKGKNYLHSLTRVGCLLKWLKNFFSLQRISIVPTFSVSFLMIKEGKKCLRTTFPLFFLVKYAKIIYAFQTKGFCLFTALAVCLWFSFHITEQTTEEERWKENKTES